MWFDLTAAAPTSSGRARPPPEGGAQALREALAGRTVRSQGAQPPPLACRGRLVRGGVDVISELLSLDRKTVRRYAQALTPEEMIVPPYRDHGPLCPCLAHLHQRWNEGCTDSGRLHAELRELGYLGSKRTVRR